jgi:hypothetical protein
MTPDLEAIKEWSKDFEYLVFDHLIGQKQDLGLTETQVAKLSEAMKDAFVKAAEEMFK